MIDKPAGWTSHDVVARVRRLLGQRQVGHAGTLDPAATGVLPVAVGDATKVLRYLEHAGKSYLASVTFGVETDAHDGDGRVTRITDASHLDLPTLSGLVERFRGDSLQLPPMTSALKVDGQRLYALARKGIEVEREPRAITISLLEIVAWDSPTAWLAVSCSKGTYIRGLARDMGLAAGCGAFMSDLIRLQAGPFTLADAWRLPELEELDIVADWESIALHPDVATSHTPALMLSDDALGDWRHGKLIAAASSVAEDLRVYGSHGEWLGMAEGVEGEGWQPRRVVEAA